MNESSDMGKPQFVDLAALRDKVRELWRARDIPCQYTIRNMVYGIILHKPDNGKNKSVGSWIQPGLDCGGY